MHVLIPIKNLSFAKQRLASLLTAKERRSIFQAMLHDVLSVLSSHELVSDITLLSDDPSVQSLQQRYPLKWLSQTRLNAIGLNGTLQAGVAYMADQGVDDVMLIHGDLPLISKTEISALINEYQATTGSRITITPDRRGTGTNCIICSTQSNFEFNYGEDSFANHCKQAVQLGIKPLSAAYHGFGCDIDYPHDLLQFASKVNHGTALHTQQFMLERSVLDRLLAEPFDREVLPLGSRSAAVIKLDPKIAQKNYAT